MDDLKKRYKPMENVLKTIIAKGVALQGNEKTRNNIILGKVVQLIIENMKQKSLLFAGMYERLFYGGSYYDNLKIGNPNEYDLDFILKIPLIVDPVVRCSNLPGFVNVEIMEYQKLLTRAESERIKYEKLNLLLEHGNFLSTNKCLTWMESVINQAINEIPRDSVGSYVDVIVDTDKPKDTIRIYVKMSKGPPAFTMKLFGKDRDGSDIQLDIDLVPCFQFHDKKWPDKCGGYRENPSSTQKHYLVVPKRPKGKEIEKSPVFERYWRLSFQEQERDMLSGQHLTFLKPSLRLLKKLRDKHNHKIASYFIKTIYLWTVEKEDKEFWAQSLSVVFITMLKKYANQISAKNIPYFWNKDNNLIGYLNDVTTTNIGNTLRNIIDDIERNLNEPNIDPFVIGKYLLPQAEYESLRGEVSLGKKLEKSFSNTSICIKNDTPNNSKNNSYSTDTTDSIPPLKQLGFDNDLIQGLKSYLAVQEESNKKLYNTMPSTSEITDQNNRFSDIVAYLKKIDDKIDKISDKIDKIQDENKNFNARIDCLEHQISNVILENGILRNNEGAVLKNGGLSSVAD